MKLTNSKNRLIATNGVEDFPLTPSQIRAIIRGDAIELQGSAITIAKGEDIEDIVFMSQKLEPVISIENDDDQIYVHTEVQRLGSVFRLETLEDDHILAGNQWFPIDEFSLDSIKTWIEQRAPDGYVPLAEYPRLYSGKNDDVLIIDRVDIDAYRQATGGKHSPESLNAELYPYQEQGFRWLKASCDVGIGGILGDEMGLGKTLQVIAVIADRAPNTQNPSLVLAPATILDNWSREIYKFAPDLVFYVHRGAKRAHFPDAILKENIDVVISSYETAVQDLGLMEMIEWDILAYDEAMYIKNPSTIRFDSVRRIPRSASILITGTPLENRTMDVWSLCENVIPGYFGDQAAFDNSIAEHPELVRRALTPLLLRREIKDVATHMKCQGKCKGKGWFGSDHATCPDCGGTGNTSLIHIPQALTMFDDELEGYFNLIEQIRTESSGPNTLKLLTRLRQYTGHPGLLDTSKLNDPLANSAKLSRLMELLHEIRQNGQKALVFSQFRELSDLISRTASDHLGIPSAVMDGRVSSVHRQGMIDDFSEKPGAALLVLNTQTGGTGLNITAANHVFHYTLEWNPASERQATGRAFRTGQEKTVFEHRMYYMHTIDELMLNTLERKLVLFDEVVAPSDYIAVEDLLTRALNQQPPDDR